MTRYRYLIVGGGMAADSAVDGIREVDPSGSIGLITAEPDAPYNRPPLSKGLWKGEEVESIWRGTAEKDVELHLSRRATELDLQGHRVVDDTGTAYGFDRLLLATGGSPRRLPYGGDRIIYFRTLEDFRRLRSVAGQGRRVAVIGAGFIGSEVAAALAMNGTQVVMVAPESAIGEKAYPRDLATFLNGYYEERGVELLMGSAVAGFEEDHDRVILRVRDERDGGERSVEVDAVVAGIGITPNTQLAEEAGLLVENGIVVDRFLRTSHPDVFAAGDAASFYSPALERQVRVEHEDNANTMGRFAGRAMAGSMAPYEHLPFFYSDLFDLGYEAVGEMSSRMETVSDWTKPYHEGVVYYLREGRVRGVLLWNVWEQVEAARRLIAEPGPFGRDELRERLLPAA